MAMAVVIPSVKDTGNYIWETGDRKWDWNWELKYSDWVSHIGKDFFMKYGIQTDCADVIIGLRWIFSRINGLPMATSLMGSGKLVGHMSMLSPWKDLPRAENWYEDQMFMAALNYVMENTYTHSLSNDSYPIAISKASMIPGAYHLEYHTAGGGHAQIISRIDKSSGRIITLNSTLPRQLRNLFDREYFYGDQAFAGTGFLRQYWVEKHDGYWAYAEPGSEQMHSTEQYAPEFMEGFGTFAEAVKAHYTGKVEQIRRQGTSLKDWRLVRNNVKNLLVARANSVYDGFNACQATDCSKGTDAWDEWSTPGRDDTLLKNIKGMMRTYDLNSNNREIVEDMASFRATKFLYDVDTYTTIGQAIDNFLNGVTSSDPRQPIKVRWGL
jgi:hypothetical protein